MANEGDTTQQTTQDQSNTTFDEQSRTNETISESRSPQPYRRNVTNFSGNNMFDPMMAMNLGMMNSLPFQMMMQQSGMSRSMPMSMQQLQQQQQQQSQQRSTTLPSENQKPRSGYICFKCGEPGHWIYYCPNVPKGQYVNRFNSAANPGSMTQMNELDSIPDELTCSVCKKLFKNASMSLCCGKSFCEDCITTALNDKQQCPVCDKEGLTTDQIIPNKTLRNIVDAFQEERKIAEESIHTNQRDNQQIDKDANGTDVQDNTSDLKDEIATSVLDSSVEENQKQNINKPNQSQQQLKQNQQQHKSSLPQKQQQTSDSNDNRNPSHVRKSRNYNMEGSHGMDSMGRGFNNMPTSGMPFMSNPSFFMGGNTGIPPFGFPDMSWMFAGSGGAGRGHFPSGNNVPYFPPNTGAPIHFRGGFSGRGRGTGRGRALNNNINSNQQQHQQQSSTSSSQHQQKSPSSPSSHHSEQQKTESSQRDDDFNDQYSYNDNDEAIHDRISSPERYRSRQHTLEDKRSVTSNNEHYESTKHRHKSPSDTRSSSHHHHVHKKRSRSRSPSADRKRKHSSSSRKYHRSSGSPKSSHYSDEEEEEDHHHRRHSRRRSRSSRRHRESSSSNKYRSSSRHHHSDDHRRKDRNRDSSRDRSHRERK